MPPKPAKDDRADHKAKTDLIGAQLAKIRNDNDGEKRRDSIRKGTHCAGKVRML